MVLIFPCLFFISSIKNEPNNMMIGYETNEFHNLEWADFEIPWSADSFPTCSSLNPCLDEPGTKLDLLEVYVLFIINIII